MTPDFSIFGETPSAPIAIIATPGAEELAQLIDKRLINLFSESHLGKKLHKDSFILKADCPRFTNGDAKGIIYETVRGKDLYIICDPGNHGITYPFFGKEIPVTPDEHFENLKRIICACTATCSHHGHHADALRRPSTQTQRKRIARLRNNASRAAKHGR